MSAKSRHFTGDLLYVADIISEEVAQALIDKLPGIEIKIPKVWSKDSALRLLDRKHADALIAMFPGDVFYIPTCRNSLDNRKKARQLRQEGKTNIEIALTLGVTERHIRGLLNVDPRLSHHRDTRQIDMFRM